MAETAVTLLAIPRLHVRSHSDIELNALERQFVGTQFQFSPRRRILLYFG